MTAPPTIHARAELRRFYAGTWHADYADVHPCGALRDGTRQPSADELGRVAITCPGCVAELERHAAACARVRFGT